MSGISVSGSSLDIKNFLSSSDVSVSVSWRGYRTVTSGKEEVGYDLIVKKANELFKDIVGSYALSENYSNIDLEEKCVKRTDDFKLLNRVIKLFEDSEKARWSIGKIVYRIIRIFADWGLRTELEGCREKRGASTTFEESLRAEILPYGYEKATTVRSGDKDFFRIPPEDALPILEKVVDTLDKEIELEDLRSQVRQEEEEEEEVEVDNFGGGGLDVPPPEVPPPEVPPEDQAGNVA